MNDLTLKGDAEISFIFFSELQLNYGIIGINEFHERIETLEELLSKNDEGFNQQEEINEKNNIHSYSDHLNGFIKDEDENIIHFIPEGLSSKWIFTKGDPDPYPSVPHGHKNSQNQSWPKLNPYTGWIFKNKSQTIGRLSIREMRLL